MLAIHSAERAAPLSTRASGTRMGALPKTIAAAGGCAAVAGTRVPFPVSSRALLPRRVVELGFPHPSRRVLP